MSEPLRLALVAEGPTDRVVIDAAISRVLEERPFILIQLQPEGSLAFGPLGGGWGGVYRWCKQAVERDGSLSNDPLFGSYDLLILHLDADVADADYGEANIRDAAGDLPCARPCPPPRATTNRLRRVLLRWVGETKPPERTVFCTPSKSTEAWVLAALFPNDREVRGGGLECLHNPESRLAQQPVRTRIRKSLSDYEKHKDTIREAWTRVVKLTEASRFSDEFRAAVETSGAITNAEEDS